ncbi:MULTISPECIES: hypothetical protein [unclassified Bradyrhizobium]|uniref:hypothetical protein n=1 Tax=unclassified Bradyrhizobium TaxID=2631580 RepID=UPI001FFA14B5|nr:MULTISPECIES: hypothetical protein [unclassified Bradyrhizobium]MCK1711735.1 hypothetical protein [Bradyrhizobium sp. 143]MCK1730002.1 hypothetical protein [Bradyrhizobium sp. 142]
MKSNLAVLAVLVARPLGRASLEDIERNIDADVMRFQGEPLPDEEALEDVNLLAAGLVTPDGDGLRITDAGRSVLNTLNELRQISSHTVDDKSSANDQSSAVVRATSLAAPSLLHGFGSAAEARSDMRYRKSSVFATIAVKFRRVGALWRKHLEYDPLDEKMEQRSRNAIGAVIAILSFMLLTICAGAAGVVMQFRSMKSEIAYLHREVLSLKERLTRIDQAEKARQLEERANTEQAKSRSAATQEAPLNLSSDEIRLIRDYIKPAQSAGLASAPMNVGDPITGPTIPLPSPVTDKVPKLIGARFLIRNGAIIIVKRDSRRADAVLGPN